jgi:hypothetical protein
MDLFPSANDGIGDASIFCGQLFLKDWTEEVSSTPHVTTETDIVIETLCSLE